MKQFAFAALFLLLGLSAWGPPVQCATVCDLSSQKAVAVTVYNDNLALIKERRTLTLAPGRGELRLTGVPARILPVTVQARSLNGPDAFSVLEQSYEYDLLSADKLLDRYVGRKLKIVRWNEYQDRAEMVEATLLSNKQGQIYRIGDEIYLGYPGTKVLPELPGDLTAEPTLTWVYHNRSERPHTLEVSYLTEGISWRADYTMVLNQEETECSLSGWVTLDNRSGAAYRNADLKLVAGSVRRVRETRSRKARSLAAVMSDEKARPLREESFFEYHLYDLQGKTTLKDQQTRQIRLLSTSGVGTKKEFLIRGARYFFMSPYRPEGSRQPVLVYVTFENKKENSLGVPLPAGAMRLYKEDGGKGLQFIGEDRFGHTPRNEQVRLRTGEAFDVVAERRQTEYRKITSRVHESEWEIKVRNHRHTPLEVKIEEPMPDQWEILSSSIPYRKVDAFKARFDLQVPPGGENTLRYRVRVGF